MEVEVPSELETPSIAEIGMATPGAGTEDRLYIALRLLWEERSFIAKVVLRGTLLFLVIALLIPATYESTTQLMPPSTQSATAGMLAAIAGGGVGGGVGGVGGGGGGGGAMSMAADLLGLRTSGALFISILRSDTVEDDLINQFDLRHVYWLKTYRSARKKLESRTEISEDRKSGVITITVSDRDRQRAAAMAQAYVDELDRMVVTLNTSAAHRERAFLEGRLQVIKLELDKSAKQFSEFSSKNTAIDIKEQGRAMVEAAAMLQGQMIAAESELHGLEQIYTPNNVRVRSVQARITELQHQLEKLGGSATPSPDASENSAAVYPSIRQLPVLGVKYADLYRELKINETVYEVLTKEYELARVQEAKEVPSVKVLDKAEVAERRSGPPRTLIVLGGMVLSFCLAAVWLFGKEAWNNTDPQDHRKRFAEEVATTMGNKLHWKHARDASLKIIPGSLRQRFHRNHNHTKQD